MELQTKFIEGTDEKYSIREDGAVMMHYRYTRGGEVIRLNNYFIKCASNNLYQLCNKNSLKYITKNKLLHEMFGHILCHTCGNKMTQYNFSKKLIKRQKCSSCSPSPEEIKIAKKADIKRYKKNYVDKITRNYAAEAMRIPIENLSDKLYEHYKNVLFFKRKIAKIHNLTIHQIK